MAATQITNKVWWVGAQHPDLRVFDVIMYTKFGTSYNAYLVKGDNKTALIDTVKCKFADDLIANINEVADVAKLDYIICNHTEPDHAGALGRLLDIAKDATVVCSKAAKAILKEQLNKDFKCMTVGDGDTIDLGNQKLSFISAPFLHWPDTMFTYLEDEKLLSTCDAFGFHFSAPNIFDDLTPLTEEMQESQKLYFDCIVSPFKSYVLDGIKKVVDLGIEFTMILPSHGPVLRTGAMEAVTRYANWSTLPNNNPKKIYIAYVSCYGYTKELTEQVYNGAKSLGADVVMEDITEAGIAKVVECINNADAFALGSPTVNRDVLKPVWDVLTSLCTFIVKGKKTAVYGSYGWSGEACKYMSERLNNLGVKVVGESRAKMIPSEEEKKSAYNLGVELAKSVAE